MKLERLALAPVRAAARSGRGLFEGEVDVVVDAVCAGPLPEAVARSLVEQRVVERVVAEVLETAAPNGLEAAQLEQLVQSVLQSPALARIDGAEASRIAEESVVRIVRSAAFRRALTEVLSSPEVRHALTRQTRGFADEVAAAADAKAASFDDRLGAGARRMLRRSASPPAAFAGLAARGAALVVDAALVQLAFLAIVGSISLVAGLAGADAGWQAGALAGAGWFAVAAAYFAAFWSGTGQTPGMRVMGVRVVTGSGAPPSVPRSLVRFVGLILAIIPLFVGFLPVPFDGRRRALQDFLAGTVVVHDRDATAAAPGTLAL